MDAAPFLTVLHRDNREVIRTLLDMPSRVWLRATCKDLRVEDWDWMAVMPPWLLRAARDELVWHTRTTLLARIAEWMQAVPPIMTQGFSRAVREIHVHSVAWQRKPEVATLTIEIRERGAKAMRLYLDPLGDKLDEGLRWATVNGTVHEVEITGRRAALVVFNVLTGRYVDGYGYFIVGDDLATVLRETSWLWSARDQAERIARCRARWETMRATEPSAPPLEDYGAEPIPALLTRRVE